MNIVSASIEPYANPTDPGRPGAHLELRTDDGRVGRGDAMPWPGTILPDPPLADVVLPRPVPDALEDVVQWSEAWGATASPWRFALETALCDLWGQSAQCALHGLLNPGSPRTVQVNGLARSWTEVAERVADGFDVVKLKWTPQVRNVLEGAADAVVQTLGDAMLRLDFNQQMTALDVPLLEELVGHCAYLEEPLPPFHPGWEELHAVGIPLALDESLADVRWAEEAYARFDVKHVVIKPMYRGGLVAALRMARDAAAAGRQVTVTGALESHVGVCAAAHLAAATGADHAHGLTTPFEVPAWLTPLRGKITLPMGHRSTEVET